MTYLQLLFAVSFSLLPVVKWQGDTTNRIEVISDTLLRNSRQLKSAEFEFTYKETHVPERGESPLVVADACVHIIFDQTHLLLNAEFFGEIADNDGGDAEKLERLTILVNEESTFVVRRWQTGKTLGEQLNFMREPFKNAQIIAILKELNLPSDPTSILLGSHEKSFVDILASGSAELKMTPNGGVVCHGDVNGMNRVRFIAFSDKVGNRYRATIDNDSASSQLTSTHKTSGGVSYAAESAFVVTNHKKRAPNSVRRVIRTKSFVSNPPLTPEQFDISKLDIPVGTPFSKSKLFRNTDERLVWDGQMLRNAE